MPVINVSDNFMINQQRVEKPQNRSRLRKFLGKEFFIIKRKINWLLAGNNFAKIDATINYDNSLIKHKSFLLRPLKDVEMYLQHNKVTNLKIAISHIDKVVIQPGQTFSVWQVVGRPTKSKGYLEGMTLHNGKISKDIGGGLCQLGNLLYWMALHTPLTIKERWRHSYDVFPDINRTIPFGCGATLAYNYIDLQLQNNTDKYFQINLWLDNEYLNGEITCNTDLKTEYKIYETDHTLKQQWWGGYTRHNRIWKKITNLTDNTTSEELVTENNAIMMYNPLLNK
ncbi:MAG: VanW family protein [Bacteroidales bacterium]|jgi:vancomycin resistance protein VanW